MPSAHQEEFRLEAVEQRALFLLDLVALMRANMHADKVTLGATGARWLEYQVDEILAGHSDWRTLPELKPSQSVKIPHAASRPTFPTFQQLPVLCYVDGCDRYHRWHRTFCAYHWFKIPGKLRHKVGKASAEGLGFALQEAMAAFGQRLEVRE